MHSAKLSTQVIFVPLLPLLVLEFFCSSTVTYCHLYIWPMRPDIFFDKALVFELMKGGLTHSSDTRSCGQCNADTPYRIYVYTQVLLLLSRFILYWAIHLSSTVEIDILVLVLLLNTSQYLFEYYFVSGYYPQVSCTCAYRIGLSCRSYRIHSGLSRRVKGKDCVLEST